MSAPDPEGGAIEDQGLGWKNRSGPATATTRSPAVLEVIWTQTPTKWSNNFFENLFGFEWELTKSPAGAFQWVAKGARSHTVPDPFDPSKKRLALDADHRPRACGWIRLTRRSRGASSSIRISSRTRSLAPGSSSRIATWVRSIRYLGPLVPKETLIWQDPIPAVDHPLIDEQDIAALKAKILAPGLSVPQLVSAAWASASTFRGSDKRGGGNGARIRLDPQKNWEVNNPAELKATLSESSRRSRRTSTPRPRAARRSRLPT